MIIQNLDLKKFINRLRRVAFEAMKSNSANVSGFTTADLERIKSYISALFALLDEIQSLPELDLPESSPKEYDMGELSNYDETENEPISDMLELFERLEDELLNSQSGRISNRFMTFDEGRTRKVLTRIQQLLDGYVASTTPLDLPESSPRAPSNTRGKRGTNNKAK